MQVINPKFSSHNFFDALKQASEPVLLLDYDGTLAPFVIERNQAVPYNGVKEILEKIISSGRTRLVIISGRKVADIKMLLKLDKMPEIWGSHGGERLFADGNYKLYEITENEKKSLDLAEKWANDNGFGVIIEKKPAGLAFHWRDKDEKTAREIKSRIEKKWEFEAEKNGLKLLDFDCGIELKLMRYGKDSAVRQIVKESDTNALFCYLGDDFTDEDAFKELHNSGYSGLVRNELRDTHADFWLKPPDELLTFLNDWYLLHS